MTWLTYKYFRVWSSMKSRCCNPDNENYPSYGGRGITVCQRWLDSFDNFCEDMGPKPTPQHSLERIDNDGNYEPGNCKWATRSEQQLNKGLSRNNTSGVTGVFYDKHNKKWIAAYNISGKRHYVGRFDTKEEAIKAMQGA